MALLSADQATSHGEGQLRLHAAAIGPGTTGYDKVMGSWPGQQEASLLCW